jgi:septal ring factor EnvC (AmiA/AmiB activator)
MKATEAKRLKELEQENSRLKRLLAEAELDKAMRPPVSPKKSTRFERSTRGPNRSP